MKPLLRRVWKSLSRIPRWMRTHKKISIALILMGFPLALMLIFGIVFGVKIAHLRDLETTYPGWRFNSVLYSDWATFYRGERLDPTVLSARLAVYGYKREAQLGDPGTYFVHGEDWTVSLRPFLYPDGQSFGGVHRLRITAGKVVKLEKVHGDQTTIEDSLRIDPIFLGELMDSTVVRRSFIALDSISPFLAHAVLFSEDRRFFHHRGIAARSIARAFKANLESGGIVQGGSTITQQLARNVFLSHERSYMRKGLEAALALLFEVVLSKERILELYLNQCYLGQEGSIGLYGVQAASQSYFGKSARDINPAEAALLVQLIPSPGSNSPRANPERAKTRRNALLAALRDEGILDSAWCEIYSHEPLPERIAVPQDKRFSYFADYLRIRAVQELGPEVTEKGYRIFSTLDPYLQVAADSAIMLGMRRVEFRFGPKRYEDPVQGALASLEVENGYIRVLTGGRMDSPDQFNRATDGKRQPGSSFKPFVYGAAIATAEQSSGPKFTPATVLIDTPAVYPDEDGPWKPHNVEGDYFGRVTVRYAIERSQNLATVNMALALGLDKVVEFAHRAGIDETLKAVPSLALGACEVTPLEMAIGMRSLANNGIYSPARIITWVVTPHNEPVKLPKTESRKVLSPQTDFILTQMLQGVIVSGRGHDVITQGFLSPCAGKTGTTNDDRDAWFVGFTPQYSAAVWVGYDHNQRLIMSGAQAAAPIFSWYMQDAHRGLPKKDFVPPEGGKGMVQARFCAFTGNLAGAACPRSINQYFIAGTQPTKPCNGPHPVMQPAVPDTIERVSDSLAIIDSLMRGTRQAAPQIDTAGKRP